MSFSYAAPIVYLAIQNNVTWHDQFQIGEVTDTSWDLNNKFFIMDIKTNDTDGTPLLSISSMNQQIIVDDAIARVFHFNVDDHTIRASLSAGSTYVYDLIMVDSVNNMARDAIMSGTLEVRQGVTIED